MPSGLRKATSAAMPNDAAGGANALVSCMTYSACSISMVRTQLHAASVGICRAHTAVCIRYHFTPVNRSDTAVASAQVLANKAVLSKVLWLASTLSQSPVLLELLRHLR